MSLRNTYGMDTDAPLEKRTLTMVAAFQSFSRKASVVVALGCAALLGWIFDLTALKSILPGAVAMKANTAISLIAGGSSLWLWHFEKDARTRERGNAERLSAPVEIRGRRGRGRLSSELLCVTASPPPIVLLERACAVLVLLIGLLTLIEYGLSLDLGIDRLLFDTPLDPVGDIMPGRMAIQTAVAFFFLGFALLLLSLSRPNYFAVQVLAASAFPIAFLGLLGYLYGNAYFYKFGSLTSIAVYTAVAFLLLCLSILLTRPDQSMVSIFTGNDAGGIVARRLLPAAMIVSPFVCWLTLLGYRSHLYIAELGTGILSVLNAIIFAALIGWNAHSLSRLDQRRSQAETALKQAKAGLEERVRERTAQLEQANEQLQTEISEHQQTEAERAKLLVREQAARESAEAANRTKDEFLAVLSHELRTPLNPILGWAKLLLAHRLDEAKTAYALKTIERNAKLQTQLIEDLLDVLRIIQGKLSLNVCPVDLVATLEAAIETVRLAAESKSIQLTTVFDPSVGQVTGDSNRLQQVFSNLLTNAVKFTPPKGQVKVQLSVVTDRQPTDNGQRTTDNYAQIRVSDTGKGINSDFLPYLFDYFRQEDSATTRKFG